MHKLAIALASLASLATTVSAQSANIYNDCSIPVYLWPVDADRPAGSPIVIQPGGSYSEPYHTPSNGGGVSLKLNTNPSLDVITQFEYTLTGGFIWYDGSNVNCGGTNCPFFPYGAFLDTSDGSCPTRTCTPGQVCTGFYQYPTDDVNSLACQPGASVNLYLCTTSANAPAAPAPAPTSKSPTTTAQTSTTTTKSTPTSTTTTTSSTATASPIVAAEAPATTTVSPKYQMEAIAPGGKGKRFVVPHAHARRHEHHE